MIKGYIVNTICEKDNEQMYPIEMPKENSELIKMIEKRFNYKKPFVLTKTQFAKIIRGGYILFECKKCGFKKMIKTEEILVQGYINAKICKTCPLDVCLWVNCTLGGYIKE
jgi:hypothetical protein